MALARSDRAAAGRRRTPPAARARVPSTRPRAASARPHVPRNGSPRTARPNRCAAHRTPRAHRRLGCARDPPTGAADRIARADDAPPSARDGIAGARDAIARGSNGVARNGDTASRRNGSASRRRRPTRFPSPRDPAQYARAPSRPRRSHASARPDLGQCVRSCGCTSPSWGRSPVVVRMPKGLMATRAAWPTRARES